MRQLKGVWSAVRWAIVAVVAGGGLWLFLGLLLHEPNPENVPSWVWYGNWRAVLITTGLFTLFLLGFARPRRAGAQRRRSGLRLRNLPRGKIKDKSDGDK